MRLNSVALACLAAFAPAAAHAQYQMFQPSLALAPQISLQHHADLARRDISRDRTPQARAGEDAPIDMALLTYRPDPARRRDNLAQFVRKTRAVDPAGADNLEHMFAQGDFIERLQTAAAPMGLHIDNVADAYSIYWINAYQASQGTNDTPSRRTMDAVRAQVARAVSATAQFRGAGDAAKQEMAEALWVQAALLDGAVEKCKNDPGQLKAVGAAAIKGARATGLDLTTMQLTDSGFVPRSKPSP